ncbi:hypothetical protein GCM10010406_37460 [Streptomyces thermolineatus]|uniref:Uncharacterized protein n=1 Tax=Streptomyces thermolineatus TaxID=44033 RepID=A0ABN3M7Z9_9ACTN
MWAAAYPGPRVRMRAAARRHPSGCAAGSLGQLWASGLLVAVALLVAFSFRTVITTDRGTGTHR